MDITSRKFIGTMLVVVMAYGLVYLGKLEAKVWLDMAVIAVGIYQAANVTESTIDKLKK
jgi:uncharacterized membrane protein AbrB (regulator of aidB expression)